MHSSGSDQGPVARFCEHETGFGDKKCLLNSGEETYWKMVIWENKKEMVFRELDFEKDRCLELWW